MSEQQQYKHWRLHVDEQRIHWLALDKAGASTNVLDEEVLSELGQVLEALERDKPAGVVFHSAKKNGFIAGADIKMIQRLEGADDPITLLRDSQALFDRIEALPCPTLALIHGFCLGGGLELALACDYRIAEESDSTKLGLPEVMLGVHPGWGGTVRLPRLIGALQAMPLILTGRTLRAKPAAKLGVVDYAVPARQLRTAARRLILERPAKRAPKGLAALSNQPWLRKPIAWQMRKQVSGKARPEHYPAPYAIIELWQRQTGSTSEQLRQEAESFVELARTDTSQNLIRVFFLQEQMKALGRVKADKPQRVHVVGAGTMGGDIAAWCAMQGLTVTLQDREPKFIAPAIKRAQQLYKGKLKSRRAVTAAMDRLIPDVEGLGVPQADLIIEAVPENLELKQQIFKDLEARAKPEAVLASNTSSIPLEEIAQALTAPERLVGIHFFNPVAKMQLVEVVLAENTSEAVRDRAQAFCGAIGRLPLPVKSAPGFLVNRVLMPYLMEAVTLIDEGVAPESVDAAAKRFGMPMGPVELADTVGLDICQHVGEILARHLGGGEPPKALSRHVARGELGRKSGRGFYEWRKGKPVKNKTDGSRADLDELADRMVYRLLNEAVACLREGVVDNAELLDGGMIFGTGFAPFRGGPINHLRARSIKCARHRLQELQERYGERFTPDAGWESLEE
ncbi:3-hydroxyacyl-CoA dehydrogenase NAD-binding domain-containing protein [Alkalilimnicola sp. S0819]|uniref:3-hydroxyacyl-CoA dehydrogenase NAD-binding domain-containing protein n=1 Tax=Alkalilimnicola sp. S0819 TaxID=2613922 RepID=UPI00126238CC|nr:3-hydroxyacyl-CoA dehydrogenase NAD-binding domain-containing protein [Alkalilimnicola sp. S0819]KAB7623623.1 crotonase [Alkalilimnicola sp. S0819]MPQ16747.1 crotonase [Alkalilimnicola sp. S0819]